MESNNRSTYNGIRAYDAGKKQDISGDFARANKAWLNDFGNDRMTYRAELYNHSSIYWAQNEAKLSHGYPGTFWL